MKAEPGHLYLRDWYVWVVDECSYNDKYKLDFSYCDDSIGVFKSSHIIIENYIMHLCIIMIVL